MTLSMIWIRPLKLSIKLDSYPQKSQPYASGWDFFVEIDIFWLTYGGSTL